MQICGTDSCICASQSWPLEGQLSSILLIKIIGSRVNIYLTWSVLYLSLQASTWKPVHFHRESYPSVRNVLNALLVPLREQVHRHLNADIYVCMVVHGIHFPNNLTHYFQRSFINQSASKTKKNYLIMYVSSFNRNKNRESTPYF